MLHLAISEVLLTAIIIEGDGEVGHEPQGFVLELRQAFKQVEGFRIFDFIVAQPLPEAFHVLSFFGLRSFRCPLEQRNNALADNLQHGRHADLSKAVTEMASEPQQPLETCGKIVAIPVDNPCNSLR